MPLKDSRNGLLPELAACCANRRCPWCMPSNLPNATHTDFASPATAGKGLFQSIAEHSSTSRLQPAEVVLAKVSLRGGTSADCNQFTSDDMAVCSRPGSGSTSNGQRRAVVNICTITHA